MTIKCEHCNLINQRDRHFCSACGELLYSAEDTISKLIKEHKTLERKQLGELTLLKGQIKQMEDYVIHQKRTEAIPKSVVEKSKNDPVVEPILEKPKPVVFKEIKTHQHVVEKSVEQQSNLKAVESQPHTVLPKQPKFKPVVKYQEPSALERQASQFFEPLFDGIDLLKGVVSRYKKEGKLPILLMTVAGILAILVGVGYLMQLSFDKLGVYSGLVKVGLGFVSSIAIGLIGKRLYKKDIKYQEYSSALLSLMIILNYLLIYFLTNLSSFPILSSAQVGFLLIVANTGLSIFIAFKYETKIIAVLSLIGGALTPFYLEESGNPNYYFGYLWILLVAANFIALHIKWYKLNYISFILFLILIEGAVFTDASQSSLFIGYIHLFAYLFFYIVLFNKTQLKTSLTKYDLLILCGNLTVLLFNLYDSIADFFWLGIVYLINGVIFTLLLVKYWNTMLKQMKVGFFITIGSFVGLAIPFLFGQELIGLFWSLEAILLIVLGFVYGLESIRKEGYFVLGIALCKLGMSVVVILDNWGGSLVNEGFLNYIVLGGVFSTLWYIGHRFKHQFTDLEIFLYSVFKEIIPLWLSSIFFIIGYNFIEFYVFNLMIISMFGLIIWHYKFKTQTTEFIGLLQMFFFGIAYAVSVDLVNSTSFTDQLLYGKIGMIELLFVFWFLKLFYEKMGYSRQADHKIAQILRVVFYVLLPLLFIKQIYKHAIPFFPIAMWVGFFMSYGLFKRFKHHALLAEAHILLYAAVGINIALYDIWGIVLGLISLLVLILLEKGYVKSSLEQSKFLSTLVVSPYIGIGLLTYLALKEGMDIELVSFMTTALLIVFTYFFKLYDLVYKSYRIALRMGLLFGLGTALFYALEHQNGLQLVLLTLLVGSSGYILYKSKSDYLEKTKASSWGINVLLHQLFIILTYSFSILVMNLDLDGPTITIFLVIHAIILLFMGLKNQSKALNKGSLVLFILALLKVVFHDIRDFSGTDKIIVLIVLGVLLLVASYGYVRVKNKYLPVSDHLNEDDE